MPDGKPAGVRCIQLTPDFRCALFGSPDRPKVCASLPAMLDICGSTRLEALDLIADMERLTARSATT